VLKRVRSNVNLYISQIHGLLWGLERYMDATREQDSGEDSEDSNSDSTVPRDFPGGLIIDEPGTGKTMKALLIAAGIASMHQVQERHNKFPVVIFAKSSVVANWEEQANDLFDPKWVAGNIFFLNDGDRVKNLEKKIQNHRIAVLPYESAKVLHPEQVTTTTVNINTRLVLLRTITMLCCISSLQAPCVIVDEAHEFPARWCFKALTAFPMTGTPKASTAAGKRKRVDEEESLFVEYDKSLHEPTMLMCKKAFGLGGVYNLEDEGLITRVRSADLPPLHIKPMLFDLDTATKCLHQAINQARNTGISTSAFNKVVSSLYFMPWLILKTPKKSGNDMFVSSEAHNFVFFRDRGVSGSTLETIKDNFEGSLFDAVKEEDEDLFVSIEDKRVYVGPYFATLLFTICTALEKHAKIVVYVDFIHEGDCLSTLLTHTMRDIKFANAREMSSEALDSFMSNEEIRIIILSKSAHGTGLNLQCASAVIMTSIEKDPSRDQQLVGRVHRPGQVKEVEWFHLNGRSDLEIERLAEKQSNGEGGSNTFFCKKAPRVLQWV
jgi:hypothetical protein